MFGAPDGEFRAGSDWSSCCGCSSRLTPNSARNAHQQRVVDVPLARTRQPVAQVLILVP
jgi:hypothetical protein